jgi:hypothetical protein
MVRSARLRLWRPLPRGRRLRLLGPLEADVDGHRSPYARATSWVLKVPAAHVVALVWPGLDQRA